jgi:signal transduction histidine kinase
MRRGMPEVLVAALIALLLGSYVWYTHRVANQLEAEGKRSSEMFAHVYQALLDPNNDAALGPLLDLSKDVGAQGVPVILTDSEGTPTAHLNLPFDSKDSLPQDDHRVRDYVRTLDAENPPIPYPSGAVHYGDTGLVQYLRVIPILQALTFAVLLLAAVYIIRTRHDAVREHVWAGMARESAHQLGTPLSSLVGWVELLEDRAATDPRIAEAVAPMRGDLERLDRVAHRFERIGREPRADAVDIGAVVDRITRYFRARVPTLANAIAIESEVAPGLPMARGDPVLLEWALEVLTKNAIDALAGQPGSIRITATANGDGGVRIRVADDGPGVPRELRDRIFDPGVSTKPSGWGIGLSLAKRIVEENHSGRLSLIPSDRGATFEITLQ